MKVLAVVGIGLIGTALMLGSESGVCGGASELVGEVVVLVSSKESGNTSLMGNSLVCGSDFGECMKRSVDLKEEAEASSPFRVLERPRSGE